MGWWRPSQLIDPRDEDIAPAADAQVGARRHHSRESDDQGAVLPGRGRAADRACIEVDHVTVYRWVQRFTPSLIDGTRPIEVSTDRAHAYPRVLDEVLPAARDVVEQYANNPIEAGHGRLKSWLRPMRGLKQLRSARVISAGHAFLQNLRRGHYELVTHVDLRHRLPAAFAEFILVI